MTDYKDRVSGWATDIDWSKAPENAKGAIVTKTCNVHHPKIVFASGYHLTGCMIRATAAEDGSPMSAPTDCWDWVDRPAPQWNGEGLPPVGITCRIPDDMADGNGFLAQFEGLTVEIVAHSISSRGHPVAVFSYTGTNGESRFHALADNPNYPNFEPIKTPAQIAADERDSAIEAMIGKIKDHPLKYQSVSHFAQLKIQEDACADLYDAGLRFPKGDDK